MTDAESTAAAKDRRVFAVKIQQLADKEKKSFANNMLHCFAALRNRWSTYEELEHFYRILKPWLDRSPIKNIKENICDWNRHMKKEGVGDDHKSDDADGCIIKEIHRVCKKEDDNGTEYFRVHPKLAESVFTESENTVNDIKPLSIRMTKRKRAEEEEENAEGLPRDDELYSKIQCQVATHKKIMRRMKNKVEEAYKIRKQYRESLLLLQKLQEEMVEHAARSDKLIKEMTGGGKKKRMDAKDVKNVKDAKDARNAKNVKDAKNAKNVKNAKDAGDAKDVKDVKDVKNAKDAKRTKRDEDEDGDDEDDGENSDAEDSDDDMDDDVEDALKEEWKSESDSE